MRFAAIFAIIFYWMASIALASNLPPRVDIEYTLNGRIGQGKAHETLHIRKENGIRYYVITSEISATGFLSLIKRGSILRHSQGTIGPHGLQPLNFTDQRGNKPAREAEFDWDGKRIIYRRKGREMTETLPVGTLDELSLSYQFAFVPPSPPGLIIHETDYRQLYTARYAVTRETLDTPIGTLETVVLTKQQEQSDPFRKKIWLATEHHLLPVRIITTEKNGLEVDQIVTKIDYTSDDFAQ